MPILDSQVHAYERNHSRRPWIGTLYGPPEVTGDQMVTAMDAVGVDGAILVSPFSMYRYDASYALDVFAAHPSRFRLVKPVDPTDPAVVDTIADWASTYGTVGIRIFLRDNVSSDPADPAINRVLATAAQHSLPVNVACTGRLDQARQLAARNPNTRLVIDHLGLPQPHEPPPPAEPFADLPKLLALASHDNVAVKISGACTPGRDHAAPPERAHRIPAKAMFSDSVRLCRLVARPPRPRKNPGAAAVFLPAKSSAISGKSDGTIRPPGRHGACPGPPTRGYPRSALPSDNHVVRFRAWVQDCQTIWR
jgi:L-fuconolactonase